MVIANGVKNGQAICVVYDDNKLTFNGMKNILYEQDILYKAEYGGYPLGGTYYTDNKELNIVEVLKNHFFDKPILNVTCDFDFELPSATDKGVIY